MKNSKISISFTRYSDADFLTKAEHIYQSLTGNLAFKDPVPTLPPHGFKPAEESALSGDWVSGNHVMEKLQCSTNTYKSHIKNKLLPVSKLGGRNYHNTADVQHLLVTLRRLSLILIPPVILFTDCLEI